MNFKELLEKEAVGNIHIGKMFAMVLAGTTAYFAFSMFQPAIDSSANIPVWIKPYLGIIFAGFVVMIVDHKLLSGLIKSVAILYSPETKGSKNMRVSAKMQLVAMGLRLAFSILMTLGSGTFMGFAVGGEGGDGKQLSQQDREARKERSEYQKASTAQITAALSSAERSAELKRDNARQKANPEHVRLYDNGNTWFNKGDGPVGREYAGHRASLKALRKIDADHAKALDAAAATADRARETMRADLKQMEKGASAAFGSVLVFEESKEGSKKSKTLLGLIFFWAVDLVSCTMVLLIGTSAGRTLAEMQNGADRIAELFEEQVGPGRVLRVGLISIFDILVSSVAWLGAHVSLTSSKLRLAIADTVQSSEEKRGEAHGKLEGAYHPNRKAGQRDTSETLSRGTAETAKQGRDTSETGAKYIAAPTEAKTPPYTAKAAPFDALSPEKPSVPKEHAKYTPLSPPTTETDKKAENETERDSETLSETARQRDSETGRDTSETARQGETLSSPTSETVPADKPKAEVKSEEKRAREVAMLKRRTSILGSMRRVKARALSSIQDANDARSKGDDKAYKKAKGLAASRFESAIKYAERAPDDEVVKGAARKLYQSAKKYNLEIDNAIGAIINEK